MKNRCNTNHLKQVHQQNKVVYYFRAISNICFDVRKSIVLQSIINVFFFAILIKYNKLNGILFLIYHTEKYSIDKHHIQFDHLVTIK
jgi:hypothetical protein